LLSALARVELIASTRPAPAPKSRRIFIVTSPKVLRPTDAEPRQPVVMVHSALITPHQLARTSARLPYESSDASIINLTPKATCSDCDLKTFSNDTSSPVIRACPKQSPNPARTLHVKIMQATWAAANPGKMPRFVS
jgi:hypothetical protein